jgi:predicted nucleic acid-binding protein
VTAKVVDASAFAAVSFREPNFVDVAKRLASHELHAPTLMRFEMANVCIKKIQELPDQRDLLIEQHKQSLGVYFYQHSVQPSEVLALAYRLKLSAYDASYLWLARTLGIELVTLDKDLLKAIAKT